MNFHDPLIIVNNPKFVSTYWHIRAFGKICRQILQLNFLRHRHRHLHCCHVSLSSSPPSLNFSHLFLSSFFFSPIFSNFVGNLWFILPTNLPIKISVSNKNIKLLMKFIDEKYCQIHCWKKNSSVLQVIIY